MQGDFTYYDLELGIREIENIGTHYALRNNIMDHLWRRKGNNMYGL
jgi:hypothetical protein